MATQTVSPAGKGSESLYLLLITVVIVATCAVLISVTSGKEQQRVLQGYQIDAFADLNAKELAVFNNLRTSAVEIDDIHREDVNYAAWPAVEQLQQDGLPPFVQDVSWKKSGQYLWKKVARPEGNIDLAVFVGYPQDAECGTMLLLFTHEHGKKQGNAHGESQHAPYEIWYHSSSREPLPEVFTDQVFIAAGWKEIRALSGADEVKRVKGVEN